MGIFKTDRAGHLYPELLWSYYEQEGLIASERNSTLSERMGMLVQHRQALNEQIARLQEHQIKPDEKIEFYRNEIERTQNNVST